MPGIREQVIRERHRSRPLFATKNGLFRYAPDMSVVPEAKRAEIQILGQLRPHFFRYFMQPMLGGFVRQQRPKIDAHSSFQSSPMW